MHVGNSRGGHSHGDFPPLLLLPELDPLGDIHTLRDGGLKLLGGLFRFGGKATENNGARHGFGSQEFTGAGKVRASTRSSLRARKY